MNNKRLGIRWTIGDVSDYGFEALELSIRAAQKLFGETAEYVVCVNGVSLSAAQRHVESIADRVHWIQAETHIPVWLQERLDEGMAEGVAWKLAPVRVFPHQHELSLDNDLIFWKIPDVMNDWLASSDPESCLMAEDTQRSLGQFSDCCDGRAINSGIRGVPPDFLLEDQLRQKLQEREIILRSELDEQGLQAAVLCRAKLTLVSKEDLTICSPFPMHQKDLGRCGVHFVGLNQRSLPWQLEGRGAHELIQERWRHYKPALQELIEKIHRP